MEINRYAIYWVDLNPTKGAEMFKIRPAVILSPNEMNRHIETVIIAPITSTLTPYPWRVPCRIDDTKCMIATDQIRTIDKQRLGSYICDLSKDRIEELQDKLERMLVL